MAADNHEREKMNEESIENKIINAADDAYRNAIFEALMHYQMVEDLLRDCIIKSYEILNASSHEKVTFTPSKRHIEDILKRKGLGGLVDTFETLTPHKDLCVRIKNETSNRNEIAHRAAADYMKFPISKNGAEECHLKATEFYDFTTIASWLYDELSVIHKELTEVHGEIV